MNIIHIFASPTWGGGEQYVYDLAREQSGHGHTVNFFSRKSHILKDKVSEIGSLQELPLKGVFDLYSAIRLAAYLRKSDTDIIHIHRFTDMCTAVFAKIIAKSHAKVVITRHQVKNGKKNPLYLWAYKRVHRIIFVSHIAMDKWFETVSGISDGKCVVIHNSIPEKQKSTTESLRKKYNISDETPVIMYAARIVPEKGIEILLSALSTLRCSNYVMICAGTGTDEYLRKIEEITDKYGLKERVIYTGLVNNIRSWMDEADIGVCPTIVPESFGLTSAEFMQAGKCVITSDNGAQKEYIEDGVTGVLVHPGDIEQLAQKLDLLLENREIREKIGSEARCYFENNLSYDKFYHKIMEVYNSPK